MLYKSYEANRSMKFLITLPTSGNRCVESCKTASATDLLRQWIRCQCFEISIFSFISNFMKTEVHVHIIIMVYIRFVFFFLFQVTGSNKGIGYAIVRALCKEFKGDVYMTCELSFPSPVINYNSNYYNSLNTYKVI